MGMASRTPCRVSSLVILFSLLFVSFTAVVEARGHGHPMTHLHFYLHEVFSNGPNSTITRLAGPHDGIKKSSYFGSLSVANNMIREGTDPLSSLIDRVQGLAAGVSLSASAFLTLFNFVFTEEVFNGSMLQVLGRPLLEPVVIEWPIIGGTGVFRMASGYMLCKIVEPPDPNNLLVISSMLISKAIGLGLFCGKAIGLDLHSLRNSESIGLQMIFRVHEIVGGRSVRVSHWEREVGSGLG
ncbi:hypothetical protein PR202_gb07914 [Eleusine coracana subsp. coracana]|uniref:Dirigent protein n=1 Tax=Eleusine coracana subsp. coracana TaxID=191504 RepID=A0AAV5ED20_ELECO|nr:hypothetical protein PR202_gb07914 [Eleusine coracana subsp. coracana]